jgi:hypothetical protein
MVDLQHFLKKHSKHLCQPKDQVCICLELTNVMVTSCQLPVRRPDFSLNFFIFAGRCKNVRKIRESYC